MCFDFFYKFSLNISHSKKYSARCEQKRILFVTYSNSYSVQILIKLEFSRQIIE